MTAFSHRLRDVRAHLELTQAEMAARLGVSRSYICLLEQGAKPGGLKVRRAVARLEQAPASARTTPAAAAAGGRDGQTTPARWVPLLTLAQAGGGPVAWESLPPDADAVLTEIADHDVFAIEVRGDSMEPAIRAGDRLVMRPSQAPVNGDVVVARFRDGTTVLKLYHEGDGGQTIHLTSFNPAYPPNAYPRSDFEVIVPAAALSRKLRPGWFR